MNNLKELEKLNTMGFKLLVFLPLVGFIGGILAKTGFDFNVIYSFYLISIVLQIILFIQDRKFLKEKLAYCPAWEWFILFPVYVYKRQKNNFLELGYFYITMIFSIITIIFSAYLKTL